MNITGVVGNPDTEGYFSVKEWVNEKNISKKEQHEIIIDLAKRSDIVNRFIRVAYNCTEKGDFHRATRIYWRLYFMVDPKNEEIRDYLCRSLISLKKQKIEQDAPEQQITNLEYLIENIKDPAMRYNH